MALPKASREAFIESIRQIGVTKTAERFGVTVRAANERRRNLERLHGIAIESPYTPDGNRVKESNNHPARRPLSVPGGVVLVAGDAHYWPGEPSMMHRAFVKFVKKYREAGTLRAVIMNGDATDLPSVSRWPSANWEYRPTVKDEVDVCKERLGEIEDAAGRVPKLWPLGNHDARWSIHLAQHAPEFAKVEGTQLKDHFPLWEPCWSVCINDDTIVKHSYHNGIHATYNNVLKSGVNMVTNHLHSAQVRPYTDYTGTRWAVDCGCIADTYAPAFLYMQDNPRNWRSAFAVLTFRDGKLMVPELVFGWGEKSIQFRGEVIKV